MTFKDSNSFASRLDESKRVMSKYKNRIPIIVEPVKSSKIVIDKIKYLTPDDLTVGQFLYVIRKRINLSSEKALYLYVSNTILPVSTTLLQAYNLYKDEDNFLYIKISEESTFG